MYKRYWFTFSFSVVFLCIYFISLKEKDEKNCFIPLSVFNIQLIFRMVIHDDEQHRLIFVVVSAYFRSLIWVVLVMVDIFGWWWVYFGWWWVVVGSSEYILGSGCWWWVVVGLFWIVVDRGGFALGLFWELVDGDGFILGGGGWW